MTSNSSQPSDRDQRLQEILAEYIELVESGSPPDGDEFLAHYPDYADELTGFLDDHQSIENFLGPFKENESDSDPETDPTVGFGETTGVQTGSLVRYIGDYEILEEIARGGMGVVFKARQVSLNRVVALKMILSGQFAHEDDVQRFRAEAEAAANLDHPGIVPIYEIGQFEGQHYFSMGLVEGASLADKIKDGPLEPRTAAEYLKKIAQAVAFAHDNGVIHRDLKPGNVLLDTNDQPKVTDFGLAKRYEDDSELTATGQILGTPGYMPPEQAAALADQMGPLADVYSLGAILYCLLTGRPPFQSANVMDTLRQVVQQEPVPPRQLNPAVPRDLETVCLKCLEKVPRKRYSTAASLGEDLERYLTHHPISARPVSRTEKAWRWAKRNPAVAGLSALAVVLLIVGTITSSIFAIEADRQRRKERIRADAEADAKQKEQVARGEAETARELAETNETEALRNLYRARLFPMKKAWQDRDFGRLDELLTESIPAPGEPDFRGWEWYYFLDQCRQASIILPGTAPYDSVAAWNPSTRNLAAATTEGSIDIWDMSQDRIDRTLPALGPVARLAWDPDGSRIATLLHDGRIVIRNTETGSTLQEMPGGKLGYKPLVWSPDGQFLAYGHSDDTIFVWDTRDWGLEYHIPSQHNVKFFAFDLAWHPNSRKLASAHRWGILTVWDVIDHKRIFARRCDTAGYLTKVCWSEIGDRLATGADSHGGEPRIMVLTSKGTPEVRIIPKEKSPRVRRLCWINNDQQIVSGGEDGVVAVWDSASGRLLCEVQLQHGDLSCLLVEDAAHSRILSVSQRGVLVLSEELRSSEADLFRGSRLSSIKTVAWHPSGDRIALSAGGGVAIVDAQSLQVLRWLELDKSVGSLEWSPNGSSLVALCSNQAEKNVYLARIWDRHQEGATYKVSACGKLKVVLSVAHRDALSFAPDSSKLAVAWDGVSVYDSNSLARLATVAPKGKEHETVAWSPTGEYVAATLGERIVVWECGSFESPVFEKPRSAGFVGLSWSPDGKRILLSQGGVVELHDPFRGDGQIMSLKGHQHHGRVRLQWAPDGRRFVTGGEDDTVTIWDAETATALLTIRVGTKVNSVDWSPDGRSLAVGCEDGGLRIFRAHHSMLDEQPNPYNKVVPILVQIDGTTKPVEVAVNEGDVVEIKDPNDQTPIKVTIDHDNKQVMLHKEGFKSAIESFNLDSYEGRLVKVWFEPLSAASIESFEPPDEPPAKAESTSATSSDVTGHAAERLVAEQILTINKDALLLIEAMDEKTIKITTLDELPENPFYVLEIGNSFHRDLKGFDFSLLPKLSKLRSLSLSLARNVTPQDLDHLREVSTLEVLSINNLPVSDDQLRAIAQSSVHLKNLQLHWCKKLTGKALVDIAKLPELEVLSFPAVKLDAQGVSALGQMQNLRVLTIHGGGPEEELGLTDQVLKLKNLRELHIGGLWLDDEELKRLAKHSSLQWSFLRLINTAITDAGLVHLEALQNLQRLQIEGSQVTTEGVGRLRKALPKCKVTSTGKEK